MMSTNEQVKKCHVLPPEVSVSHSENLQNATINPYVDNYVNQVFEKSSMPIDKVGNKKDLNKVNFHETENGKDDKHMITGCENPELSEGNAPDVIYNTLDREFVTSAECKGLTPANKTECSSQQSWTDFNGSDVFSKQVPIDKHATFQSYRTQNPFNSLNTSTCSTGMVMDAKMSQAVLNIDANNINTNNTVLEENDLYGQIDRVQKNSTEKIHAQASSEDSNISVPGGFVDLEIPNNIANEIKENNSCVYENVVVKNTSDSNVWPWLPVAAAQSHKPHHHGDHDGNRDNQKWAWMEDDLKQVFHKNYVENPNHSYTDEPVYMLYDVPNTRPQPAGRQAPLSFQNQNYKWPTNLVKVEENDMYSGGSAGGLTKIIPSKELYTIDDVDEVLYDEPPDSGIDQPPHHAATQPQIAVTQPQNVVIQPQNAAQELDNIYENCRFSSPLQMPLNNDHTLAASSEDDGWPSSDFESIDDDSAFKTEAPQSSPAADERMAKQKTKAEKSKMGKVVKSPSTASESSAKGRGRLGRRSSSRQEESDEEEGVLEVYLSLDKHPAPSLKATPAGLTPQQLKRRAIVSAIIDSETSYTSSLERIVQDYEKPLLESKPQILNKTAIKTIFYKVRDILQCHNMFRIELAECIKSWDEDEVIGHVFTASFHKTMVFDVYSAFVNNFSVAMETVRHSARHKPAFADFLKQKMGLHADKLSLFGLMVKPVQRFPQFILFLQDLLKNTRKDHHDRLALQLALTELENLTHRLNDTKRESENRLEVKTIQSNLSGWPTIKSNPQRYLIRQDDMTQMKFNQDSNQNEANVVSKSRRLFMMNDMLMCTTVIYKDAEAGIIEKFKLKWCVPINEVEVVDSAINADYRVLSGSRSISVYSKKAVQADSPWKKELDDLLHDLPVVIKISQLVSHLRNPYPGLSNESVTDLIQDLQNRIEEKDELDWSTIQLGVPTKSGRLLHTFQVSSPSVKQEWLFNLCTAVLALDPKNNPGWGMPENETHVTTKLPLFMQPLLLDVTKQQDMKQSKKSSLKMSCAIPVYVPNSKVPGQVVEHLWACSGDWHSGHVTVVSLNSTLPHVTESFKIKENKVVCAERVPGYPKCRDSALPPCFVEDTVWMATASQEIVIHKVHVKQREEEAIFKFSVDSPVMCMSYLNHRIYLGLANGYIYIYSRTKEGEWKTSDWRVVQLNSVPVLWLLPIGKEMWCACAENIHVISLNPVLNVVKHKVTVNNEGNVQCMVTAGVGLIVAFQNEAVVRLFHLESMEHLQDINLASAIVRVLKDKYPKKQDLLSTVRITTMMASKGMLWIGTNIGCVLSLPLPRLEGVPQIRGRPSVSFHAHKGPIRFLVPVQCISVTAPGEETYDLDQNSLVDNLIEKPVTTIQISGVTETESSDDSVEVENDMYESEDDLDKFDFVGTNGRGSFRASKSRWTSTPDIRSSVMDDNAYFLYGSLLRGTDLDPELEMVSPYLTLKKPRGASLYSAVRRSIRKGSNRLRKSLLDTDNDTVEKCHTNEAVQFLNQEEEEEETSEAVSLASEETSKPGEQPSNLTLSQTVASGGDGYIDWNRPSDKYLTHDDICLLLWQCRK